MADPMALLENLPADTTILRFAVQYPVHEDELDEDEDEQFATFEVEIPKDQYEDAVSLGQGDNLLFQRTMERALQPRCAQVHESEFEVKFSSTLKEELSLEDFLRTRA